MSDVIYIPRSIDKKVQKEREALVKEFKSKGWNVCGGCLEVEDMFKNKVELWMLERETLLRRKNE